MRFDVVESEADDVLRVTAELTSACLNLVPAELLRIIFQQSFLMIASPACRVTYLCPCLLLLMAAALAGVGRFPGKTV